MGNSNLEEARLKESHLEVFKYSSFYGRHQLEGDYAVKKYELAEEEKDAFLGLIQSYQKISHQSLIVIENVQQVKQMNDRYFYELSFPYYQQTLASQIQRRKDKNPFSQQEVARLLKSLVEVILIFQEKQFPFGHLSPDKIARKDLDQGYCIGIQILMNSASIGEEGSKSDKRSNAFISPQQQALERYPNSFDRMKSMIFTLGLIALHTITSQSQQIQYKEIEELVFDLRKDFSYQFCNLLQSMLHLDNSDRISLQQCHQSCVDLLQKFQQIDQPNPKTLIRGYNCVQSIWLLDNKKQQSISNRWASKQRIVMK